MKPDIHHPLFERDDWRRSSDSNRLRTMPGVPFLMDYDTHHFELHKDCRKVQFIGNRAVRLVLETFKPASNPVDTIDNLMVALGKAECDKSIDEKQRVLTALAIESLYQQLPYIKYGYIKDKK